MEEEEKKGDAHLARGFCRLAPRARGTPTSLEQTLPFLVAVSLLLAAFDGLVGDFLLETAPFVARR